MSSCPCGNRAGYEACCGVYIAGAPAPTAEALMRSRYTAFATGDIDHLEATLPAAGRRDFDREAARLWATGSRWLGLEILSTEAGGAEDETGTVEFVARYADAGGEHEHHEVSQFAREQGRWVYVEGRTHKKPVRREAPKVGRNDPCPCGSSMKYKRCCGRGT